MTVRSFDLNNAEHSAAADGSGHGKFNLRRCLFFVSLASFVTIVSSALFEPAFEQYVYQVYTEQVYGNASVTITNTPCVDSSSNSDINASITADNDTDNSQVSDDELRNSVQSKSADFMSRLEILSVVIGSISCLFLGTYSDVIGRRLVLLVPAIGHFLHDVLVVIVIRWDLGLPVFFVSKTIFALVGGNPGFLLGSFVYTADVTTTEKGRTVGIAIVGAAMGAASAATQYAAGVFIQETGFVYPTLTASLCSLSCVLLIAIFLPETMHRDPTKPMITPLDSVKRIITTFLSSHNPQQRWVLLVVLIVFFAGASCENPVFRLDVLFLMNQPFCWSSSEIGLLASIKFGVTKVTAVLLVLMLKKVLSTKNLATLGAVSYFTSHVLMALATTDLMVYLAAGAMMAATILFSATRAIMSRMVPADRQGALFGGIAVVESVCFGVGQVASLNIYKAVVSIKPGIIYMYLAFWYMVCIILLFVYGILLSRTKDLVMKGDDRSQVEKSIDQTQEEKPSNGEIYRVTLTK